MVEFNSAPLLEIIKKNKKKIHKVSAVITDKVDRFEKLLDRFGIRYDR